MSFLSSIGEFLAPVAGAGLGFAVGGPVGAMIGGSLGGGVSSALAQSDANQANAEQASNQMAFQERMSNTAYQRATADMVKAGINPALAITNGGASSPGGASASIEPANMGSGVDGGKIASALSTAASLDQSKATTQKIQSDTGLNAGVAKIQSATARNIDAQSRINSAQAVKEEQSSKFYSDHPWLIPIKETLGTASSAASTGLNAAALLKVLKPSSTAPSGVDMPSKDDRDFMSAYKSYKAGQKKGRIP